MKKINTTEAVGHVLCHDMTRIVPGKIKETRFRKGHRVTKVDIPVLLSMGKEHLFVWENNDNMYHEDEGAEVLHDLCRGPHMRRSGTKEGKIELFAEEDGLFLVDEERLNRLNSLGEMMIATRANAYPVKKGDKLAGMRVIPLVIEKAKMEEAKGKVGQKPLLELAIFTKKRVGIIVTGSEVYEGRIKDAFGPALVKKLGVFDVEIIDKKIAGDDPEQISAHIEVFLKRGADMILCTGGMSVDPDDTTPTAIKNCGATIVSYGAPVLPGAMFLIAYTKAGVPVMGLPGCVMYSRRTIFDLVLPYVMANKKLKAETLQSLGAGGLCLECEVCTFPNCSFGK